MTTIEGNKLIAEFCGFKFYPEDSINGENGVFRVKDKMPLLVHEFQYHSSWDWLMPAYKKFFRTWGEMVTSQKRQWQKMNGLIAHSILECDIESAFKHLAKAIKWYNKQNKQP